MFFYALLYYLYSEKYHKIQSEYNMHKKEKTDRIIFNALLSWCNFIGLLSQ